MTQPKLLMAFLFGLFACGENYSERQVQQESAKEMPATKDIWTIYSKQGSLFHVKRLFSSDTELILLSYDINTSVAESAVQTFITSKILPNANEAARIKSQNASFNWTPYKSNLTLFVQIEYSAFSNEMEALDKRQEIEQKIDRALKSKVLGSWTAGDIGPGGANMLFKVSEAELAASVILKILSESGLNNKAIIGRRIYTKEEDWFYEVVYPSTFNGKFITM